MVLEYKGYEQYYNDIMNKNPKFELNELEKIEFMDMARIDPNFHIISSRDLTKEFFKQIEDKIKRKEINSFNIMGAVRSGKSYSALEILRVIKYLRHKEDFDGDKNVCGNQQEFRQKLKDAKFGEPFLIDENAFANFGVGSSAELLQLRDLQNITAKNNNDTIYITPRQFLNTNAYYGLKFYGKDSKNWISRWLLYKSHGEEGWILLGHIKIDVSNIFTKVNKNIEFYKYTGPTNPKKTPYEKIPKSLIKKSKGIPKDYKIEDLEDHNKSCPFYKIATNPVYVYERKKDKWIKELMSGGSIDSRTMDKIYTALKIIENYGIFNEEKNRIELKDIKNKNEVHNFISIVYHEFTSTKFTITEMNDIKDIINMSSSKFILKKYYDKLKPELQNELNIDLYLE